MIGRGGQGTVLKVRHLEWNQELALKLPLPTILKSRVSQERYLREAETWIQLGLHPNIVRCWFVKPVTGLPGLFLDFVERGSLETWIKERRKGDLDSGNVVRMMLEACEGLAYSHSLGVVHRDVKPANLLLDVNNRIQVTDFGLVKTAENQVDAVDPSAQGMPIEPGITGTGEFVGTPSYGAPEQWVGGPVGPAVDIYALGVVFYELLCGRRPFDEPKSKAEVGKLIVAHLNEPPRDPREFNPNVPADLAKLCLWCLEKKSENRPPSMRALMDKLRPIYKALVGQDYLGPAPVSEGERPDLLNNAAVSLYSLGQPENAGRLLARGLRKEAGHAECLYNLVQIERRTGVADGPESLRRLRRANLKYPLAALCVEEGLQRKALETLASIPVQEWNGMAYRTKGDALMYMRKYGQAVEAYEEAVRRMPGDKPTQVRLEYAREGKTSLGGKTLFPSPLSCAKGQVEAGSLLKISHNSVALVEVTAEKVTCLNINSRQVFAGAARPPGATEPEQVWLRDDRVLIQDKNCFELWSVPQLKLLTHSRGRVLANSPNLKRLLLQRGSDLILVNKRKGVQARLVWPPDQPPADRLCAAFGPHGGSVHLLTDDGRLGLVNPDHEIILDQWPGGAGHFHDAAIFTINARNEFAMASRSGLLEVLTFPSGGLLFTHRLPFVPTTLCADASSTVLIASSPTHSAVFDSKGRFLFQSLGPLALNADLTRFLAWELGRVCLYQLRPFRKIRSWAQNVPQPWGIDLALDGRRAATVSAEGEYHVWEVDEDNRVYERALLLTPGQAYEELVASYKVYEELFTKARDLTKRGRYPAAYLALCEARAVAGFYQAEAALATQWAMTPHLRRGSLEAIWERLTTERVRRSCLSSDSKYLALVQAGGLTLWRNAGSETSLIRSIKTKRHFLGLHFIESETDGMLLASVDSEGMGECQRVSDGEFVSFIDCGSGWLRIVKFIQGSLFFVSQSNMVGHYDLSMAKVTSTNAGVDRQIRQLFPVREHVTLAMTDKGPILMDLRKQDAVLNLSVKVQSKLTYLDALPERNLFLLGLSNGMVLVTDEGSGKILFKTDLKVGPISGFKISPGLSLGVAVTSRGKLALWDLSNGETLEKFTAHPAAIVDLQLSTDGRYLTTIADTGQFRLWETSWVLTDESGPPPVSWLKSSKLNKLGRFFKVAFK